MTENTKYTTIKPHNWTVEEVRNANYLLYTNIRMMNKSKATEEKMQLSPKDMETIIKYHHKKMSNEHPKMMFDHEKNNKVGTMTFSRDDGPKNEKFNSQIEGSYKGEMRNNEEVLNSNIATTSKALSNNANEKKLTVPHFLDIFNFQNSPCSLTNDLDDISLEDIFELPNTQLLETIQRENSVRSNEQYMIKRSEFEKIDTEICKVHAFKMKLYVGIRNIQTSHKLLYKLDCVDAMSGESIEKGTNLSGNVFDMLTETKGDDKFKLLTGEVKFKFNKPSNGKFFALNLQIMTLDQQLVASLYSTPFLCRGRSFTKPKKLYRQGFELPFLKEKRMQLQSSSLHSPMASRPMNPSTLNKMSTHLNNNEQLGKPRRRPPALPLSLLEDTTPAKKKRCNNHQVLEEKPFTPIIIEKKDHMFETTDSEHMRNFKKGLNDFIDLLKSGEAEDEAKREYFLKEVKSLSKEKIGPISFGSPKEDTKHLDDDATKLLSYPLQSCIESTFYPFDMNDKMDDETQSTCSTVGSLETCFTPDFDILLSPVPFWDAE